MKIKKTIHTVVLITALLIAGCLPPLSSSTSKTGTSETGNQTFLRMEKADFTRAIEKLTEITRSPQTSKQEKAEAHRQLAIIYLIPRNPKQDPNKATNELGKFLEMSPDGLDQASAASWATAIKSAREYREMERKAKKLSGENRQLTKANKKLAARNAKLEEDIEKLKNLDLSLEKKRQLFR
jgi:PBP1b-binding outer membrane lipoprotein LpoB